jgi:hypothetical protein
MMWVHEHDEADFPSLDEQGMKSKPILSLMIPQAAPAES